MTTKTTERDLVEEAEALLKMVAPDGKIRDGASAYLFDMRGPELLRRLVEEVEMSRRFIAEVAELGCLRGRRVHCVEREPRPADWCVACRARRVSNEEKQSAESV